MEQDLIQTGKELSPIIIAIIAIIAAVSGLISGAIASLVSPWVHYYIESRRKSIEYRTNLIKDTRSKLDQAQNIKEIRASSLWGFIDANLNEAERKIVFPGAIVIEVPTGGISDGMSQCDLRKQGVSNMLSRLEKEWKLTKT